MKALKSNPLAALVTCVLLLSLWWGTEINSKRETAVKELSETKLKFNIEKDLVKKYQDSTKVLNERLSCSVKEVATLNETIKKSDDNWRKKYYKQVAVETSRDTIIFSDTKQLLAKYRQPALEGNKQLPEAGN